MLESQRGIGQQLQELVVCPVCKVHMDWSPAQITCRLCRRQFPILDGVPVLLLDRNRAEHDELDNHYERDHKVRQSAYFDRDELAEFEIDRPRNTPRLYQLLLREKFRRSVSGIERLLPGGLVLTVCGGSGMDAEFLAEAGAYVLASDISLGAALRCRERAQRYHLPITAMVADVEHLPFRDRAFDIVYVHDGLHHLRRPCDGLSEMARVADRALSVTEPAQAMVTTLAMQVGLAHQYEEAGNLVQRLRVADLTDTLALHGFAALYRARYAMYYRHQPGIIFRALSSRMSVPLVELAWRIANVIFGRLGNKLSITAIRISVGCPQE